MPPRPRPQFSHVRLLVKDFRRSWRFYRDSLGLAPRKGHGEPPYGEFDAPAGAIVSIFERDAMTTAIGVPIRAPT